MVQMLHKTKSNTFLTARCLMLLLVSTHQGPFSSRAVKIDKKQYDLNYNKLPKRNYFHLACSILKFLFLKSPSFQENFFCNKCFLIFSHLNSIFILIMSLKSSFTTFLFSMRIKNDATSPG